MSAAVLPIRARVNVAVAGQLKAARPGMEVLFMSGYTGAALGQQSGGEFAGAFLPKPFTPDGLSRRVREILDA